MEYVLVFIIGAVFGAVIALVIRQKLISQTESQEKILVDRVKEIFGSLSLDALSKNTDEFLKLATQTLSKQTEAGGKDLEGKKELIDQTFKAMKGKLEDVQGLVNELEKDRERKFGELTHQLKSTAVETGKLQKTTNQLQSALASTTVRGQWGERMAEDVLRLAGFIEGINYQKQKTLDTVRSQPDYTFLLPQNLKVNMDAKFPLDNYFRYLKAEAKADKIFYKKEFLKNVRERIKEVTTRDYINPAENTLDYVIVFIPNEQVYAFINENDRTLLDESLKKKVVLCSPTTLYAILAVIRQAVDNFNLEKTAAQMLSLLGAFRKQYDVFMKSFGKMGEKIEGAQKEFNNLTSTRRNQLERPLRKIDDLRKQKGISSEVSLAEEDVVSVNNSGQEKKELELFNE